MKEDLRGPISIISIICCIWIILTRAVLIFLIDILRGEAIPFYNIVIGSMTIDLFQVLIVYSWVNIISGVLTVAFIHLPLGSGKWTKYFWVVFGLGLCFQPIFLTIIGVLVLIYGKNLFNERKEITKKAEGV